MRIALTSIVAASLVTALALSACGRKGPLERPPAAVTSSGAPVQESNSSRPNRPFILDRLLR